MSMLVEKIKKIFNTKDNEDRREFLINQGLLIIKDYDILEAIRNAFK